MRWSLSLTCGIRILLALAIPALPSACEGFRGSSGTVDDRPSATWEDWWCPESPREAIDEDRFGREWADYEDDYDDYDDDWF